MHPSISTIYLFVYSSTPYSSIRPFLIHLCVLTEPFKMWGSVSFPLVIQQIYWEAYFSIVFRTPLNSHQNAVRSFTLMCQRIARTHAVGLINFWSSQSSMMYFTLEATFAVFPLPLIQYYGVRIGALVGGVHCSSLYWVLMWGSRFYPN